MTEFDDLPWYPPEAAVQEREPAKCRRHRWVGYIQRVAGQPDEMLYQCVRCNRVRDSVVSRRGRLNRSRGNAIEREMAAKLGLRRTGMYGGPDDASSDWLVVQVKSGGYFPERAWTWLSALPANAGQTRAVVIADTPGPGKRRRAVVIVSLEDWAELHGGEAV